MTGILDAVEEDLRGLRDLSRARLVDVHLRSPFTVVLLQDGAVGSAGNYAVQNAEAGYDPERARDAYLRQAGEDPLLLDTLRADRTTAGLSLRTAILSALSQPLLAGEALARFGLRCTEPGYWPDAVRHRVRPGDTATVIGFGGGLDALCGLDEVKRLYLCDFMFEEQTYREAASEQVHRLCPEPERVELCPAATPAHIAASDLCFITGSALCNGTMEGLLEAARCCREVIVQGPSCSVFPAEFFRRSATLVLTTRKSRAEFEAGRRPGDQVYAFVDEGYIAMELTAQEERLHDDR